MTLNILSRYYGSLFKMSSDISNIRLSSSMPPKTPVVRFNPNFPESAKIIMPVSFSRYVTEGEFSSKKAKEYDYFLNYVFEKTSYLLRCGLISSIDILSTGDHQRICWSDDLTQEVEQHFLTTHKEILLQQSNVLTLNEWIAKKGESIFTARYEEVILNSSDGSDWHHLMLKTHRALKISSSIEKSLEYQRKEYAAMSLMNEYTHLIYSGSISISWAYLYQKYSNVPVFSQAKIEKSDNADSYTNANDSGSEQTTSMLLSMIKDTLTSSKFPADGKASFVNSCMGLFYAYGRLNNEKWDSIMAVGEEITYKTKQGIRNK